MEDVAHRPVASGRDLDASSRDRLSVKTERQHGGCHGGPVTLVGPGQAGGGGTLTGGTPPPQGGTGDEGAQPLWRGRTGTTGLGWEHEQP